MQPRVTGQPPSSNASTSELLQGSCSAPSGPIVARAAPASGSLPAPSGPSARVLGCHGFQFGGRVRNFFLAHVRAFLPADLLHLRCGLQARRASMHPRPSVQWLRRWRPTSRLPPPRLARPARRQVALPV
eukprot:2038476-Alexandrium_andersonii.AAC.1